MSEVITTDNVRNEALELHQRILTNGRMAAMLLCDMSRDLKTMRDRKLYEKLGMDTFEEYTTKMLGFKERQAYTYISAYENLGEAFLQSNAEIGITKLSLLTAVPVLERQELVENNDLAGMSVAEVKKLVAENSEKAEQIELLSDEISSLKNKTVDLERELKEANERPTEVAVAEMSEEEKKKITDKAYKAAEKELKAKFNKQRDEAVQKATDDIKKSYTKSAEEANNRITELEGKLSEANNKTTDSEKKLRELEKKLLISCDPETVKFEFYFKALQADIGELVTALGEVGKVSPDNAKRFGDAVKKYLTAVQEEF